MSIQMSKEGTSIVVDVLIRGAFRYGWGTDRPDLLSAFHREAALRLMQLALDIDKDEVKNILQERTSFLESVASILV